MNLRPGNWNEALVRELLPLADVVKLNEAESEALGPIRGMVCETRADRGCVIEGTAVPGYRVKVADAVGAGDAFSAGLLHGLSEGWPPVQAADFANRVGAIVATRRGREPILDDGRTRSANPIECKR